MTTKDHDHSQSPSPPPSPGIPGEGDRSWNARCLTCDYELRNLPIPRCPECGRAFDPRNASTMKMGRLPGDLKRWLTERLNWPAAAFVAVPMLALVGLFSEPGPYYGAIAVIALVAGFLIPIILIWPAPRDGGGRFRRTTLIALIIVVCGSTFFFELPLRIRFALSWPAMHRALQDAQTNPASGFAYPRRVGLFQVGKSVTPQYSSTVWRFYIRDSVEEGFGYSDTPVGYAGVNGGAGGHLFGGWYWFSDD